MPDPQEILRLTNADISRANNYFRDYIEDELIERYNVYYSNKDRYAKLYPETTKLNTFRTFDLWSAVEWILPDLLSAFFSTDRIISISGVSGEDADKAEKVMKLIQWQLTVKNQGYKIFKGWFGDAVVTNLGVLKCYWRRETKQIPHLDTLDQQQLTGILQNPQNKVISSKPVEDLDTMLGLTPPRSEVQWVENIVTVNQPVIELVKPSDIRFVPDGRTLAECSMVAQRKLVTIDFLRKEAKRGVYDSEVVEEIANTAHDYDEPSPLEVVLNNAAREASSGYEQQKGRMRVVLYECYSKMDINDDGVLEDVIINICNDKLLRVVENPWGRVPLFELVPFWDNYQVWSKVGFAEIVKDVQDTHTVLLRQMIYGLGLSNQIHAVVDPSVVNMNDLYSNAQFVRTKGGATKDALMPLEVGGLNAYNFQMFEYIKGQLEQWSAITRYSQGTDGSSLNKTATGINMIMGAAQRRQEEIARNFAETGLSELYRFLIKLNQQYIDQPQVIRLQNAPINFDPSDLEGDFDLAVDASSGAGAKQSKVQVLTEYMERLLPAALQLGVAGPEQFILAGTKLLKLSGIEDAEKYLFQQPLMQMPMPMSPGAPAVPGVQSGNIPGGIPAMMPLTGETRHQQSVQGGIQQNASGSSSGS